MGRRGWREGSVYRRSDGSWVAAISLGRDGEGRRVRKEYRAPTRQEAARKLAENLRRLRGGLPLEDERMTLGAYAESWLAGVKPNVRASTWAFYEVLVRLHLRDLAHLPLIRLTPAAIRSLVAERVREGYAPRTVRGVLAVLGMVLRQAQGDGFLVRNPAAAVAMPKLEQRAARHFSVAEARRFLAAVVGGPLEALYVTALGTGLRRGELLALQWGDVDLDGGLLRVRAAKTPSGIRDVPLPAFVVEVLRRQGRGVGPLWRVSPSHVSRRFTVVCARAGLPRLTFHELRHSCASLLLAEGVEPLVIASILGHSKVVMTARYAHVIRESQIAAMSKLGEVLG